VEPEKLNFEKERKKPRQILKQVPSFCLQLCEQKLGLFIVGWCQENSDRAHRINLQVTR
jgi:hypothetical protein